MKDVLKTLLPKGAFWRPIPDGELDNLFNGMGDNADEIYRYLSALAFIRDPARTIILSDLEKEYGVLTDLRLDEETRRAILASYAYAKPGTGSEDNLEEILRGAGFNVRVYQNNGPTIDPAFLLTAFQCIAGTTTAIAGNEDAFAGESGGYLIVNGAIFETILTDPMQADGPFAFAGNSQAVAGYYLAFDRERVDYDIPTDPDRFRYVFFIGGEASGWIGLRDWNMEKAGISDWVTGPRTTAIKTLQAPYPLPEMDSRAIRITSEKNADQQIFDVSQPDPSLEMSALMYRAASGDVISSSWQRFINDGDMERSGVSAWIPGNNAVLTKQTATPYDGKQYLRIAWGGGPPQYSAGQSCLRTSGRTYRIIGAARGDGVVSQPVIRQGGVNIWTGTSSATWQPFDFTFTSAVDNFIRLYDWNAASTGYVEFDDIAIYELVDLVDGNMEAAGVGAWSNSPNATLTKETGSPYRGSRCLRVECNAGSDPYAYQTILVAGQRYIIKGFIRSDGNAVPNIRTELGVAWIGTTNTDWQQFGLVFKNPAATQLRLAAITSTVGEYCEFDQITIEPLLPDAYSASGGSNGFEDKGFAIDFNGSSDWINCGNIADYIDNFTLCAWIQTDENDEVIIGREFGGSLQYSFRIFSDGKLTFSEDSAPATDYKSTDIVNDGKWHFVCVVIDGSSSQLYIDGQPNGSSFSPTITSYVVNLEIASRNGGGANFFDGKILQPIIFSTRKSAAEIFALYELGKTVALTGGYVEQRLDELILDPVSITGIARGDGQTAVPMIAIYDPVLDEWITVWVGGVNYNEQAISAIAENGISAIRLYNKFNEASSALFDDIDITNPQIAFAQIPNEQREAFERLVLKYKHLSAWAGAVIEYT